MSESDSKPSKTEPPTVEPSFNDEFAKVLAHCTKCLHKVSENVQESRFGIAAVALQAEAALLQLNNLPNQPQQKTA